jgi:putative endonuclease
MGKYFTYFARCNDGTLYAGYTTDIQKREEQHNEGKGARYTRAHGPVEIVYFEEFKTKSEAMKREYEMKRLKKVDKEQLLITARKKGE